MTESPTDLADLVNGFGFFFFPCDFSRADSLRFPFDGRLALFGVLHDGQ